LVHAQVPRNIESGGLWPSADMAGHSAPSFTPNFLAAVLADADGQRGVHLPGRRGLARALNVSERPPHSVQPDVAFAQLATRVAAVSSLLQFPVADYREADNRPRQQPPHFSTLNGLLQASFPTGVSSASLPPAGAFLLLWTRRAFTRAAAGFACSKERPSGKLVRALSASARPAAIMLGDRNNPLSGSLSTVEPRSRGGRGE
jgi:hypothetical protein